jgi:hypothetical protein
VILNRTRIVVFALSAVIAAAIPLVAYRDYIREPVWMPEVVPFDAPVTVGWGGDLVGYEDEIRAAVAATNDEIGCSVLSLTGTTGTITLLTSLTRAPCGGFQVRHPGRPTTVFCKGGESIDVQVDRLGESVEALQIFRHELGHAIGLAHDESGLMAPTIAVTTPLHSLSTKDRRALRARYCQ